MMRLFSFFPVPRLGMFRPLATVALSLALTVATAFAGKSALIIVDMQRCFGPGGSLAVKGAEEIVSLINQLRHSGRFDVFVFTQDWHCPNHISFASAHPGKAPFETITLQYTKDGKVCGYKEAYPSVSAGECAEGDVAYALEQTLWPVHCVGGAEDAELLDGVEIDREKDLVIHKGYHCHIDSYSAFADNGQFSKTNLDTQLKALGVTRVAVVGVATDYCCFFTAVDAHRAGYDVTFLLDATRGISQETIDKAIQEMRELGIKVVNTSEFLAQQVQTKDRSEL